MATVSEEAKSVGFEDKHPFLERITSEAKHILIREVPDPLYENPANHIYDVLTFDDDSSYYYSSLFRLEGTDLHDALLKNKKINIDDLEPVRENTFVQPYIIELQKQQKKEKLYDILCNEFDVPLTVR